MMERISEIELSEMKILEFWFEEAPGQFMQSDCFAGIIFLGYSRSRGKAHLTIHANLRICFAVERCPGLSLSMDFSILMIASLSAGSMYEGH